MNQVIYAVAALTVVMLFSMSTQRGRVTGTQEMYVTEARTRMMGVARETVERIARTEMAFDEATDSEKVAEGAVYPYVAGPGELTPGNSFGGCADLVACDDLDDFHGVSVNGDMEGLPYNVDVAVAYVDALTGGPTGSQTFAKELTVTVSTPALSLKGETLSVGYSRVFTYPSLFDFALGVASRPA